jgi:hypothetical protein
MTSKRIFHRTEITIEVLSEEYYDPESLGDVEHDIGLGDCSGDWHVTKRDEVDGATMAKLLQEQASDPEFFQLDDEGNDLDEEEEGDE